MKHENDKGNYYVCPWSKHVKGGRKPQGRKRTLESELLWLMITMIDWVIFPLWVNLLYDKISGCSKAWMIYRASSPEFLNLTWSNCHWQEEYSTRRPTKTQHEIIADDVIGPLGIAWCRNSMAAAGREAMRRSNSVTNGCGNGLDSSRTSRFFYIKNTLHTLSLAIPRNAFRSWSGEAVWSSIIFTWKRISITLSWRIN